jgi:hypothetical protein
MEGIKNEKQQALYEGKKVKVTIEIAPQEYRTFKFMLEHQRRGHHLSLIEVMDKICNFIDAE